MSHGELHLNPHHEYTDPVIIYMDEQAMKDYGQKPETWDRSVHARLLRRLTEDKPRVVVFDVVFTQPGEEAKDEAFAEAIRENGRTVLAGDRASSEPLEGSTLVPPLELFETNAAAWGTAKVIRDFGFVVRRYDPGNEEREGLAWAAARVAGAPVTKEPGRRLSERRWLNYYGVARPFKHLSLSYTNAENPANVGFFRDKAVFIGGQPETLSLGQVPDVFGTPWDNRFIPGVEITAIAYANLMHNDWLRRLNRFAELAVLLLSGCLLALGPTWRRSRRSAVFCRVAGGFPMASIGLVVFGHTWSCGVAVPLVQLPFALFFCLRQPNLLPQAVLEQAETVHHPNLPPRGEGASGGLVVSDHTLVGCIGEGAYGQVWIARNAIGLCHAVKVIYRSRFGTDAPYDRAFRGIQKFMPISRSHEGFIHVLHVGRDDERGMFYYIMEAADDQRTGQSINPEIYAAKSLATELQQRKTLPATEALELMLRLTEAVDRLHQHQLIHRDIKPANIVFVRGQPKLADIDLVTDLSHGGEVTQIGTQGYMAPEGPGTAAADVFSLGRILYVVLTGKRPEQCPELPTRLDEYLKSPHFMELIQVSCKACEPDLERRYSSAELMREELEKLRGR